MKKGIIGSAVKAPFKAAKWWGKNPYRAGVAAGVMGTVGYQKLKRKKKMKRRAKYRYSVGVTSKSIVSDIMKFAESDINKGGPGSGWSRERGHKTGSQGGQAGLTPKQAKLKPTFRVRGGERVSRGIKYIAPGLMSRIKHIAGRMQQGFLERGLRGAAEGFILARKGIRERKIARRAYYGKKGKVTPKDKKMFDNLGANLATTGKAVGVYAISQGLMGAVDDMARGVQETLRRNPYAAAVNVGVDPNILQAQASALYDAATGKVPAEHVTGPALARYINRRLGVQSKASPIARVQQLKERAVAQQIKGREIIAPKMRKPRKKKWTPARQKLALEQATKFKSKFRTNKLLKSIHEDMEGLPIPDVDTLHSEGSTVNVKRKKSKKLLKSIRKQISSVPVSGTLLTREDLAGRKKKKKDVSVVQCASCGKKYRSPGKNERCYLCRAEELKSRIKEKRVDERVGRRMKNGSS